MPWCFNSWILHPSMPYAVYLHHLDTFLTPSYLIFTIALFLIKLLNNLPFVLQQVAFSFTSVVFYTNSWFEVAFLWHQRVSSALRSTSWSSCSSWPRDHLTKGFSRKREASSTPLNVPVEPVLSSHPLLSGQLSKSRELCPLIIVILTSIKRSPSPNELFILSWPAF